MGLSSSRCKLKSIKLVFASQTFPSKSSKVVPLALPTDAYIITSYQYTHLAFLVHFVCVNDNELEKFTFN